MKAHIYYHLSHPFSRTNLQVKKKINKSSYDDTWLVKMEDTIRYLDNILRNPNRFIVNEEEVIKMKVIQH